MANWSMDNMTPLDMVKQFATCMNQPTNQVWNTNLDNDFEQMRYELIQEEFEEFTQEGVDPVAALKELADLIYVCYGYAASFGWDLDEAVKRVHESNLSKLGNDGKPIYREDGKVLKGPNYKKPNLEDLV